MKTVDVCLSPDLLHLYHVADKVVVVVDILRATSCMVTGIAHGANSIVPFADMEECMLMGAKGYLTAGERNGQKVDGFDLGNSPYDYMQPFVKGADVAVTTTNGTVAIEKSKNAIEIVIGSFLNITALADHLKAGKENVLILCAGWKGKVNLEDSLFAGALSHRLKNDFEYECDAPMLAEAAYLQIQNDLVKKVQSSSHAKRLNKLNVHKDIEFCLQHDVYDIVPVLKKSGIVRL